MTIPRIAVQIALLPIILIPSMAGDALGGEINRQAPGATVQQAEKANPMNNSNPQKLLVYTGTYTRGESEGIYHYWLDLKTGELTQAGVTSGIINPSFLAIHPNRRYLYAVAEVAEFSGQDSGGVIAYKIDPRTGDLTKLNQQPTGGGGPCHIVVDHAGKNALVANYGGGSVAALPF
jgi:6-phosphogluconolactonase